MSFVSMLEDAISRLENDIHMARKDFPTGSVKVPIEEWKPLALVLSRGEKILSEASTYLDLATDPEIDLAKELKLSSSEINKLKNTIASFQETSLSLASRLKEKEAKIKELDIKWKELKTENNQLTKKLNEAFKENPEAIYEQYTKGINSKKR